MLTIAATPLAGWAVQGEIAPDIQKAGFATPWLLQC